jgi:hypothetical protein
MFSLIIISLAMIFSIGVGHAAAATGSIIYVNGSSGNDSNNGYTWSTAKLTIKNATGTVVNNGIVKIANGQYKENNISINYNMKIMGQNQKNTIINNTRTAFNIPFGVNATISYLTFINGNTILGGDYKFINDQGNLVVNNCTFTGDTGGDILNGGTLNVINSTFTGSTSYLSAIQNNGTLNVIKSSFIGNTALNSNGGAIYNNGTSAVNYCTFTGNFASLGANGGAIFNSGILNVTDSTFKGNIVHSSGSGGGAIYNTGTLILKSSNFLNNLANFDFGGALYNTGTSNVFESTFINNTASNEAGGAIFSNAGNLTITGSTFTNNNASYGGAIFNNVGNVYAHFNRIVSNTAKMGSAIYNNGGKVDATLNWWGYNTGANVAKQIYNNGNGSVNYNPWIVLTIKASPATVYVGETSTITADLLHDSNGVYKNPDKGVVPYMGSANFKTTKGTIKNTNFVNGKATSTLIHLTTAGIVTASATVDDKTVTTIVTIRSR